jgi:hypothetical protein
VREAKVAHQVLVTTFMDHRHVSKDDLSVFYARRWNVELDLRNLKSTTGTSQNARLAHSFMWETCMR